MQNTTWLFLETVLKRQVCNRENYFKNHKCAGWKTQS